MPKDMEKAIRVALMQRRTDWTEAHTATPGDKAWKRFCSKGGGLLAVGRTGYHDDPEQVIAQWTEYAVWLEEECLSRIVAKETVNREIPPAASFTRHEMAVRQLAWNYYQALARAAERELRMVRGTISACQEIVDSDRARLEEVDMDEWHFQDEAGAVVNVSRRPEVRI